MIASRYERGNPHLAKTIAAYMAAFWIAQEKPLPDCVVPLSIPWNEKRRAGGNPHIALASECAHFFDRPCLNTLKHRIFKTGDAEFTYRPEVFRPFFTRSFTRKKYSLQLIEDKDVLLIALRNSDLDSLVSAAESLQECHPKSVSALTFI